MKEGDNDIGGWTTLRYVWTSACLAAWLKRVREKAGDALKSVLRQKTMLMLI